MAVYSESRDEDEREKSSDFIGVSLPKLKIGDKLIYLGTFSDQCFTQPGAERNRAPQYLCSYPIHHPRERLRKQD